jgi:GTP-binding protein
MTRIVLLGRPNVGKSSLFNALIGREEALVAPVPGVTRDWREGTLVLNQQKATLVDTAGLDDTDDALAGQLSSLARSQAQAADVVLFVLDGRDGILPADEALVQDIRRLNKPVLLLVNKVDTKAGAQTLHLAGALGLGDPFAVSAAHTMGLEAVKEALVPYVAPLAPGGEEPQAAPVRLAIVGRPNAGKSTLVNTLLGEDRLLTGELRGLTRESLALRWVHNGREFELIDTPGQRRKAKVVDTLEQAAVSTAQSSLEQADVVVLLVDATAWERHTDVFHQQDAAIAQLVIDAGKPLVVALNKWDAIEDKQVARREAAGHVEHRLHDVPGVPVVALSAARKTGIKGLLSAVEDVYARWHMQVGTSRLNRALEDIVRHQAPPLSKGQPVRLKYITQTGSTPPTFTVWGTRVIALPTSYKRYVANVLRQTFGLAGVPMRLFFKGGKNPYVR